MAVDTHPAVTIATLDHLDAMMELERAGFEQPDQWSRSSWQSELTAPSLRVLVSGHDQIDGVIALRLAGELADLDRIVVEPQARRRGVARRLITAGLSEASAAGAEQMILEVRSDNLPARQLYRSAGFHELTVRKGYYGPGRDAVIMKLIMEGVSA